LLHKEFSKYYTGFEMNVSMGLLRTIRVYVVGNAERPGAYTVSSLSTLVNALFEAGGPSKTGTMRDIQVKRNDKTIVHFDMYDLLLKGDKTKDIRLMPEDVIFIPHVGTLVGIAGNVRNPAIYELKGETRLFDLIQMAGGLTSVAFKGRVQVQRIEDHQFRTIFEGDLIEIEKNPEKNFAIRDGDLVKVFSVVETKNTIIITGAVANPGEYGVTPGVTKVRDVISLSGGLLYYASNQAEITRIKVTQAGPQTERLSVDLSKAMEDDPKHNVPLEINDYLFVRTVPEWELYR
ncbi:MAG: polysaccharide export protein, partial [Nitrospirae bacterium CG_4_9_14_3_um_filter_41_27]